MTNFLFQVATFRLKEVLKNESNYESRLKKYEASMQKVVQKKTEDEEKLEKRIREVQEYFGYWIDPKNPRFEVMFTQKEAEEKKVSFSIGLGFCTSSGIFGL